MSNTASVLAANSIRVPTSGLQVIGGPLSVSNVKGLTAQFVEYAPASTQPAAASGAEQEYLWNTSSPLSQSGLTWLTASNWSYVSATSGGTSVFTPGANGLGLYFVTWAVAATTGGFEYFINKNVTAKVTGNTTAYGTNNMKALTTYPAGQSGGTILTTSILISSPTDFIAFGACNNTSSNAASGTLYSVLSRTYLRIQKQ